MPKKCSECGKWEPITVFPYHRPELHEKGELCRCNEDSYQLLVLDLIEMMDYRKKLREENRGRTCPNCGEEYDDIGTGYDGKSFYIVCEKCLNWEKVAEGKPWRDET